MTQLIHSIILRFGISRGLAFAIMWAAIIFTALPNAAFADTCNSTNGGMTCMSDRNLPGTCQDGSDVCKENADPDGTCTSDPEYNIKWPEPGKGIVATIIANLKAALDPMAAAMFSSIMAAKGFHDAITAAVVLYVTVYAVSFTFGMVQLTVYDFFIRMVKIGIIGMLLNGNALGMFGDTFVKFFNDGTDDIITHVSQISIGGNNLGGNPFDWMDNAIVEAVSTKMLVTLMAAALTGPYGWVIIILLTVSLYTFIKAMLNAVWVYIMALVMRTLLFGLAPLFLACIMFSRTRQLFDGWLNQVVNSCLQPIFLFTFFAFFVQLIKSGLDQLISMKVCWTEWAETLRGAPFAEHYWRFAVWDCNIGIYVPFDGTWGYTGPDNTGCGGQPIHPVGIMLPLTLWILADLAKRFNVIVVQIAKDIANASTSFEYKGSPGGGDAGGGAKGGGGGAGPGGKPGGGGTGRASSTVTPGGGRFGADRTGAQVAEITKRQAGMVGNRNKPDAGSIKPPMPIPGAKLPGT